VFSLKTDTDLVTLTYDLFTPGLIVQHLYAKFGDPSCVGYRDIVCKHKQTALKTLPTRLPTVTNSLRQIARTRRSFLQTAFRR